MKKLLNYVFFLLLLPMSSVGQISIRNLELFQNVDSTSADVTPVVVTDSFSVIEIQSIIEPVARKCNINGKQVQLLQGAIIPVCRNQKSFFRHNQIYFIRLRNNHSTYGVISITKKNSMNKGNVNIVKANTYLFTIKPYYSENVIPNEKIYFEYEQDGVLFRVRPNDLFIENIYTTENLNGLEYIEK